ncbi:hypothetical protein E4U60_007726 [Claviceps pazoutovae]|uniref:DUF6570 domain-containing protein n=1 Tax=Claviceps pazoutovae TaxID=1649127 RepID=A0A9P7MEE1_9HYPO|nr:hypothetical protein E4U60_007726 [Claviceps pazoutovae]
MSFQASARVAERQISPAETQGLDNVDRIWKYRGSQYHYKGHIISLLKDVGTVYDTLPLLPSELDTIVSAHFRSREGIAVWLNWLVENNPLYRHVVIDPDRLSQLPVDGDVSDQLPTVEADDVKTEQDVRDAPATDNDSTSTRTNTSTSTNSEELWEGVAVPHLMARQTDVDAFKEPDSPRTQLAGKSVNYATTSITKHSTASTRRAQKTRRWMPAAMRCRSGDRLS